MNYFIFQDEIKQRSPLFQKIYEASFYLLSAELQGLEIVHKPHHFLSPVNGYQFPKKRKFYKLDQPRPLDKEPLEWIIEAIKEEEWEGKRGILC